MLTTTPTTRDRIVSLLSDGKPRTTTEMHSELEDAKWRTVVKTVEVMVAGGILCVAAGFAHRPSNGHTARRYVLNQGVTQ